MKYNSSYKAINMQRIALILLLLLAPTFGVSETLILSQKSITFNGNKKSFILEVDIKEVEAQLKFDPTKNDPPLSIKQAVKLAITEFRKQFKHDQFGVASIELRHFPSWDFRDRWYYSVNLFVKPEGNSGTEAAVLFSGKVFFPKEL